MTSIRRWGQRMSTGKINTLKNLMFKAVIVRCSEDQISVETEDGWSLHIYNVVTLSGMEVIEPSDGTLLRLVFDDYVQDETTLSLKFRGGGLITIDMSDNGYSGPEAMQLNGPDGSIVIWN